MVIDLLKQNWRKAIRSKGFYKNLAVNILFGFFVLYFAAMFLMLGFLLDQMLEEAHHSLNPTELFNGSILYIILAALTVRFLMQQLSTIDFPSYQMLPIKRTSLINFLILKPLASIVNYLILLIIVPFAIKSVAGYYDGFTAFRFVVHFIFIIWFDSLFAAFLKRKFGTSFLKFLLLLLVLASVIALEYFKVFSLFEISKTIFNFLLNHYWGTALLFLLPLSAFFLNKWFFSQNYYPEEFNKKIVKNNTINTDLSFFNRFGTIGEFIGLEIKLILRHKRTKNILYVGMIFLLYGLLFYSNDVYGAGFKFFVAMFMTGLLMLLYGQWLISWDSTHFDSLMSKNISISDYLNANFYLMAGFNVICFVITTPYFLYGMEIVYLHLAAFIFNLGFNTHFLLFFATYNTKRIDLSKASAFNYQGTTFKNFLIVIPMMFIPMILVAGLSAIFNVSAALWTVTIIGALGIIFHPKLMQVCINQFNRRKYALAEGFREKE